MIDKEGGREDEGRERWTCMSVRQFAIFQEPCGFYRHIGGGAYFGGGVVALGRSGELWFSRNRGGGAVALTEFG
jgi:hypothetical protein